MSPIRERILQLIAEPQYLEEILRVGAQKAADIAIPNLCDVRQKIGFANKIGYKIMYSKGDR